MQLNQTFILSCHIDHLRTERNYTRDDPFYLNITFKYWIFLHREQIYKVINLNSNNIYIQL